MSIKTLLAITKGEWLLNQDFVIANLGLITKLANGETIDFGLSRPAQAEPVAIHAGSGGSNVYAVYPGTDTSRLEPGSIAQVDIVGPVLKYGDVCSFGSTDTAALIENLAQDPNIAGIILNIDSPGGQASGTALLADAIKAAGETKPVVAIVNDGIAASAAMWIASAASEIYLTKKTDAIGSIGVFTTLADWYSYAKGQGLNIRDVYAPQSTDKNADVREALAGNDEPLKESLGVIADAFISTIEANRAGKLTSSEWNTGKMFKAKDAVKIGLADGIKNYSQVVKRVQQLAQDQKVNNNNSNTMAFEKILATANITAIDVVDGGFLVSEETLNAIENKLSVSGLSDSEAEATALVIADLRNQLAAKDEDFNATVTALNVTISEKETAITAKDEEIKVLKEQPASTFKPVISTGDQATPAAAKFRTSFDLEMETILEMRGKK